MPGCLHIMGMRASIHIDHRGIFLGRIEIGWLHHTPIQVSMTIGRFHASLFKDGLIPSFPWVGCRTQHHTSACLGINHGTRARHIGFLPDIQHVSSAGREASLMHTPTVVKECTLARLDIHPIDVLLQVSCFLARDDDTARGRTESHQFGHHPSPLGELPQLTSVHIHQIQMCISVPPTPVDKPTGIPGQEGDGMQRFHIFVGIFCQESTQLLT